MAYNDYRYVWMIRRRTSRNNGSPGTWHRNPNIDPVLPQGLEVMAVMVRDRNRRDDLFQHTIFSIPLWALELVTP